MNIQKGASGPRKTAARKYANDEWAKRREAGIKARREARQAREGGFEIGGAEYRDILARYTNTAPGSRTPAARLDGLISNEDVSSSLVRQWIIEKSIDLVRDKHLTLTAALFTQVCKCTSVEALIHERYGISVDLIRAADLYESRRRELQAAGTPCPAGFERELWDTVIRIEIDRQQADFDAGRRKSHPRWLPLADGSSTNPRTGRPMACGGYDAWQAFLHRVNPDAAMQARRVAPSGDVTEWTPSDGIDHTSAPVIDADWMARHGIDRTTALDVDSATPRLKQLYLILGDMTLARLADRTAQDGERARDVLRRLGLSDRETRTGVRFELLMLRHPKADRVKAWNWACAHAGTHHAGPGRAMLRRYLGHVADAVNRAEALEPAHAA